MQSLRSFVFALLSLVIFGVLGNPAVRADESAAAAVPPGPAPLVFSDTLLPGAARADGAPLSGSDATEGGVKWSANKGVVVTAGGATSTTPSGAHLAIPVVAGIIHIQADVNPQGTGFVGLALGRGDLSANFWPNLCLMFHLNSGGYFLMVGTKNLVPKIDKTLIHPDAVNHLDFLLDTTTRTVTAQVNGTTVLDGAVVPPTVEVAGLTAAGFRFNDPFSTGTPAVSNFKVEVVSKASAGFTPTDLTAFSVTPDTAATLTWHVASPGPTAEVPYVITDYSGATTGQGTATMTADHIVAVTQTFSRGYHEITFPQANETFGLNAIEAHQGPADPFFCMDAALSWLDLNPGNRTALVKLLARSGIAMARERQGIGAVNPIKGKYDWEGGRHQFDTLRKQYAENNIKVLEMIHSPPHYLTPNLTPYPENLADFAVSTADTAKHWSIWGGAEAGNEPDLRNIPAEQYVPMVKAMSYALDEAKSDAPLVAGVFATIPPGPYFDTCAANGMLDDANAVSLHSYDQASGTEAMIARYRAWLKNAGKEAMPLWHTECGWAWKAGTDRPEAADAMSSAVEISAKAVESRACGIARYFPFDYVYYVEGPKNFSMMGSEVTPLRSMVTYVACIEALSGKQYLGDMEGLDSSINFARVFGAPDGSECVAVLYTGKVDPAATVPFSIKAKRVQGADGRSLAATNGTLPIPDGMTYVWLDRADLGEKLKTDSDAMRLYQLGQHPLDQKRLMSPLVLEFLSLQTPSKPSTLRYLVSQELAHALPLNVRVHNLSTMPIPFTPEVTLPGGTAQLAAAVTVPPMSWVDVAWSLDASSALDIAETRMITISGKAASGIQPSPLAIPVVMDGTMDQHLKRHKNQLPLPITDMAKWLPNNSGGAQTVFSKTIDGTWQMDMKFPGGPGGWTYPIFQLPAKVDSQLYSGFLIKARILKAAGSAAIMVVPGDKTPGFWLPDLFPSDGDWHVVYAPFAEFKPGPGGAGDQNSRLNPESWAQVRVGFGSRGSDNTMEISDLILVGGE